MLKPLLSSLVISGAVASYSLLVPNPGALSGPSYSFAASAGYCPNSACLPNGPGSYVCGSSFGARKSIARGRPAAVRIFLVAN